MKEESRTVTDNIHSGMMHGGEIAQAIQEDFTVESIELLLMHLIQCKKGGFEMRKEIRYVALDGKEFTDEEDYILHENRLIPESAKVIDKLLIKMGMPEKGMYTHGIAIPGFANDRSYPSVEEAKEKAEEIAQYVRDVLNGEKE